MVALLPDHPGVHEILEDDGGVLVLLMSLLQLGQLLFHCVEPGHLGANHVLLLKLGGLLLSYLDLYAPPLRILLEHVHAGTVQS